MGNAFRVPSGTSSYEVSFEGENCTFQFNLIRVKKNGSASVVVYPEAGYALNLMISSVPCDKRYDLLTNTLTLSNISGNTTVSLNFVQFSSEYKYTGARAILSVPYTGYYEVEVSGAQGGIGYNTSADAIAKGGYIKAILPFNMGRTLYIYVGGNGGGGVYTSGGGGGFGYGSGTSGGAGASGNGYTSCGGGGGGGGSKIGLDDDTVFAEASGGGGCGGHSSGNPFSATGHHGGGGGTGGGINGGSAGARSSLVHDNSVTSANYGGPGGASAVGAGKVIQSTPGGSTGGLIKIKYVGIVLME